MEDRAMSPRKETEAMVAQQPIEDWTHIPWRKLEQTVYRLQKRIYQASLRGNDKAVHSLQRLLMKSKAARTLAVRRVTQDNQGKRTAGVDGVKSVKPAQRPALVHHLRHHKRIKPQATRRVWCCYVDTWWIQCVLHQHHLCRQIRKLSTSARPPRQGGNKPG